MNAGRIGKRLDIKLIMAYPPAPPIKKRIGENPTGIIEHPATAMVPAAASANDTDSICCLYALTVLDWQISYAEKPSAGNSG